MADSRNKGASFERQICKLIKQNLNYDAKRNLDQYQSKGMADIIIPGWSIECKAYQKSGSNNFRPSWWQQAKESAAFLKLTPVLIYKFNNCPIKCVISLDVLSRNFNAGHDLVCEVELETWFYIVRERDVIS